MFDADCMFQDDISYEFYVARDEGKRMLKRTFKRSKSAKKGFYERFEITADPRDAAVMDTATQVAKNCLLERCLDGSDAKISMEAMFAECEAMVKDVAALLVVCRSSFRVCQVCFGSRVNIAFQAPRVQKTSRGGAMSSVHAGHLLIRSDKLATGWIKS